MKLYIIILLVVVGLGYGIYQLDVQYDMLSNEYSSLHDNYSELRTENQEQAKMFSESYNELLNYSEAVNSKAESLEQDIIKYDSDIKDIEELNSKLGNKVKNLESFSLDLTPSIFEVRDFLAADSTNSHSFVFESYDCTQFAHEVVRNALARGLFACTVEIDIGDGGHIIIAFNTSERGVVYFEPQTDREVTLRAGKKYWAGNDHGPVQYNDTIIRWTSCF